jgi:hypothetical protein
VWENAQGAGTPGTQRDIAFSQLVLKGLNKLEANYYYTETLGMFKAFDIFVITLVTSRPVSQKSVEHETFISTVYTAQCVKYNGNGNEKFYLIN